jgi:hypothetical protein
MGIKKLNSQERAALLETFLKADAKQLKDARFLATILCDDERNKEDAFLALTYYYALDENKDELNRTLSMMMLDVE